MENVPDTKKLEQLVFDINAATQRFENNVRGVTQSAGALSTVVTDLKKDYKKLAADSQTIRENLVGIETSVKYKLDESDARKIIKEELHEHRDSCPGRTKQPLQNNFDYLKLLKVVGLIAVGAGSVFAGFHAF